MTARTTPAASAAPIAIPAPMRAALPAWGISADDLHLFNEGTHSHLFQKLGAHLLPGGGVAFAVWAPGARYVAVIGDFNNWDRGAHPLARVGDSGVWSAVVPDARSGSTYKFHIASASSAYAVDKTDPFGFRHEMPPRTASIVHDLAYTWGDAAWMASRGPRQRLEAPVSIYEVHLGSWMRDPAEPSRLLSYGEIAPRLAEHCLRLGFTHVELLPIMEHPFYPSWGYQTTGYFAPTSRYGSPQDFMALVDTLHQAGIGVVLDWVPSHFPTDEHGLGYFDGTHLFEHADPRQGFHPEWKSSIFNYDRHEVRAFLVSSAIFWLTVYHADSLRVDAVASMLYLDYARTAGEWIPNRFGGRENLGAVEFLRQLNAEVYRVCPDAQTIAEESTAWPMVSRPVYLGGLGFGYKWDMGWMHDTLKYLSRDPIHRRFHHTHLNFRGLYMYNEHYVLPLSHDEVVHMKGSLIRRMPPGPGDDNWQRFANLRLLLANQWTHPGKKLLFMGGEFAQWAEWNFETSLDWHLLERPEHAGIMRLVADLNALYRRIPALHAGDADHRGFEWVEANDSEQSVLAFLRRVPGGHADESALAVFNCTPVIRSGYRLRVPVAGRWAEVLNTDAPDYGGSGVGNLGSVQATRDWPDDPGASINLTLPPLAALVLIPDAPAGSSKSVPGAPDGS